MGEGKTMTDKISSHFRRSEFSCTCSCGFNSVDVELVELLEKIRAYFDDRPVTITSGNRCKKKNNSVGSKTTSQHTKGTACDFKIKGVEPQLIYDYIDEWHEGGLGIYKTWVHLDVRGIKARWDSRK
jgi:uncharacterized protein YcbK (DUF882 family)